MTTRWRTSTRSNNGSDCVEVALSPARVQVRDTKDRTGPMLTVSPAAWATFVASTHRAAPGAPAS